MTGPANGNGGGGGASTRELVVVRVRDAINSALAGLR